MGRYESFDLHFEADESDRVSVRLGRPGCAPQPFELPEPVVARLEDPDLAPSPEEIGSELYRALFRGSLARELALALDRLRREERDGLRLRLVLDPSRPELARISALPWELLYDPHAKKFFGQDPRTPIVRFLEIRSAEEPRPTDPPLAILLAYAEPSGLAGLRLKAESERLYEAAAHADVHFQVVQARSPLELRETLEEGRFHILHFMGHGKRNRRTRQGVLVFEDDRGRAREVAGPELAHALRDLPTLRLAVLNACDTDAGPAATGLDPYAGVASALVQAGIPAVIAMRSGISDSAALRFSETLYRHLSRRDSIEEAVTRARMRLVQEHPGSLAWATPSVYLQSMDGDLFDLSAKRCARLPWWRTWAARGAAAGLLLLTLFWLLANRPHPSPASFSPELTNPEECRPLIPDLDFHYVRIDSGSIDLGSPRKRDLPELGVSIVEPFCLGRFEITRGQWWYVMERPEGTPPPPPAEQYLPAEDVSYTNAQELVRRLNERVGQRLFHLPTELQWEYAATLAFPDFEEMELDEVKRYVNCGSELQDGYESATKVGSLQADRIGAFDLLGNVYEWVIPLEMDLEEGKVVRRGGSYKSAIQSCSPTHRKSVLPSRDQDTSGLRIVREIRNP